MKTFKEFFTLGVNKPTKKQIQDYVDRLGSAVRLLSQKDLIKSIENYFKTIKNLKLDRSGRKVLAFEEVCCDDCYDHIVEESEYQGKKVKLNDPKRASDGKKKFYVYVKNEKGNVVKVGFGDPNMEIKRDDPARRKAFRARHNCDDPGPKWKARYWSCYQWRAGAKVDN
tara:strand:+ start:29 stop:535 length:507 start_codon:yes stop_codon:yes gene_type:complete